MGETMERPNEKTFLLQVLGGQADAVAFCQSLARISQIVDDLHDQDKPVAASTIKAMAWEVLVQLPSNPFYQRHFPTLQGMVRGALNDWFDSTVFEASGNGHDLSLAFVLRDSLTGVVSQCAYLVGGYNHMITVSPQIRRYFHDETLPAYIRPFQPADPPAQASAEQADANKRKRPAKRKPTSQKRGQT